MMGLSVRMGGALAGMVCSGAALMTAVADFNYNSNRQDTVTICHHHILTSAQEDNG
jgi:hypothetical protein